MNKPEVNLANKYLGNHFQECLTTLEVALAREPDTREKPLVATVRGTGGGKTRLLEEIRLAKNKERNCVVLSITFNNKTLLPFGGESFTSTVELNVVLSMLARITATTYDLPLEEIIQLIESNIGTLDHGLRIYSIFPSTSILSMPSER
jgi:hypothetical protein